MIARPFAVLVLFATGACESEAPQASPRPAVPRVETPADPPERLEPPEAVNIDKLGPAPTNAAAFVEQSPAPSGAGLEYRHARAMDLLAGGDIAVHLPERAHDARTPFDADRIGAMAPPARNPRPRVLMRKPTVKGSLPVEVVRRFLRRHIHQVRACYDKLLVTKPSAKGAVSLSWTVNTKGEVEAAKVTKTTFDGDAPSTCILTALKTWSFVGPSDGDADQITAEYVLIPPVR